jgi:hypothetical protein
VGADGDEIGSDLRIIISGKANRSAMMNLRIVSHSHTMIQGRGEQGRGEQRPYAVVADIESLPSRITTLYRRLTE